jgi:hypothetical protein
MIGIRVSANLPVREPDEDSGVITWLHCTVYESDDEGEGAVERDIGSALIALVHVGEAADHNVSLLDALDAEGPELEALYSIYFRDGWIKDELSRGHGNDLLYIDELCVDEPHRERNVDLAVLRQLCVSFAGGCELIVMPYSCEADVKRWASLGFVVSTEGQPAGFLHLQQAAIRPRVVDVAGSGGFRVVPNLSPVKLRKMN